MVGLIKIETVWCIGGRAKQSILVINNSSIAKLGTRKKIPTFEREPSVRENCTWFYEGKDDMISKTTHRRRTSMNLFKKEMVR